MSSLCYEDWSRRFDVGSLGGFRHRFFLTNQPRPGSIRVFLNGEELYQSNDGTVHWTYDFASNSVNFSPFFIPEADTDISVRYRAECL